MTDLTSGSMDGSGTGCLRPSATSCSVDRSRIPRTGRFRHLPWQRTAVRFFEELLRLAAQAGGLARHLGEIVRIEVDVGDGGEEPFDHVRVDLGVHRPFLPRPVGPEAHPFEPPDDQILQGGDIRLLAADADLRTAGAAGRLFALVTEHLFHAGLLLQMLRCLCSVGKFLKV